MSANLYKCAKVRDDKAFYKIVTFIAEFYDFVRIMRRFFFGVFKNGLLQYFFFFIKCRMILSTFKKMSGLNSGCGNSY